MTSLTPMMTHLWLPWVMTCWRLLQAYIPTATMKREGWSQSPEHNSTYFWPSGRSHNRASSGPTFEWLPNALTSLSKPSVHTQHFKMNQAMFKCLSSSSLPLCYISLDITGTQQVQWRLHYGPVWAMALFILLPAVSCRHAVIQIFAIPLCAGLMLLQRSMPRHGLKKTPVMLGEMVGWWWMAPSYHSMHALHSLKMFSLTENQTIHWMYRWVKMIIAR